MDIYAKGQLSFLILNCLLERDFYGLDIISEIKNRSNGRIDLKKPSVYSNLTRMEKQGYVSSYMRSSDLGPNRRYYSVTEKGRGLYQSLKEEFERNHFNVFRDFNESDAVMAPVSSQPNVVNNIVASPSPAYSSVADEDEEEEEGVFKQDDFFDFSSLDETISENKEKEVYSTYIEETSKEEIKNDAVFLAPEEKPESPVEEDLEQTEQLADVKESPASIILQQSDFISQPTYVIQQETIQEKTVEQDIEKSVPIEEEQVDDAKFIAKTEINDPDYNKRIYDITKDFNKYRKRRSFAEDQMSIEVSEISLQESEVKKQQRLDDFKSALLANKNKYNDRLSEEEFNQVRNTTVDNNSSIPPVHEENTQTDEEHQDDGVFITNRIESLNQTRKIEPPRLKIIAEKTPLPAPKRDATIDPSHKEIISRLYSKSKDSSATEAFNQSPQTNQSAMLYDYEDLKDYYKSQHISFKTYEHDKPVVKHNTNKINLVVSLITFVLMSIASAAIFAVLYTQGLTNPNTSFLYLILPGLFFIDVCGRIASMKYTSWEPKPMLPQWQMWLFFILCCGVIVGLNFIFGLSAENFILHFATLVLPLTLLVILFPVHYYMKRFGYIKYWR